MKQRSYKLYVEDMLEAMDKIHDYTEGLDHQAFSANQMVGDAVIRNLEVIGEAARNLPEHIRNDYAHIPWKAMIGLRNIAIHNYFGVDVDIIWEIITRNIPETRANLEQMCQNLEP